MGYNRITIRLVIRVILIFIMLLLLAFMISIYNEKQLYITTALIIAIIVGQVWEMIRWLQKTNRLLFRFVEALGQGDFATSFNTLSPGSTSELLLSEMNRVMDSQARRNLKQGSRIGFLEVLIEHLPNGIICWGKNEKIVYQNPAAGELLNIGSRTTWSGFFSGNPEIKKMIYDSEGERSVIFPNRIAGKNRLLKIDVWPFSILGENIRVMTIEDITSELLKKESESWQDLLRLLSHEIRNSITPITSLTETMTGILTPVEDEGSKSTLDDQNVQDIIKAIGIIQDRTVRLRVFTENVLKVTRIPPPEKGVVKLKDLINDIESYMSGELENSGVTFKLEIPGGDDTVHADPIQLELIFTNLISNSLHSLKEQENPEINILLEKINGISRIIFEDNGCGIPDELMEKIFMPFFTTRKNGYGLGLSIVRQMVNLHGGSIYCESEEGRYTRFVLEIPK